MLEHFLDANWFVMLRILHDWLNARDITALDSAFCSTLYRPLWLQCLARLRGNKSIERFEHRHKSIRWLIDRQVKVTSMKLNQCAIEDDEDVLDEDGFDIREDTWSGINMPTLENVNCYDFERETDRFEYSLDDAGLEALSLGCPNITRIFLGRLERVSADAMGRFASRCSKLECVKVTFVMDGKLSNFTSVLGALSCCPIKELIIFECSALTDRVVHHMALYFPRLEKLSIIGCRNITDVSLTVVGASSLPIKGLQFVDQCGFTPTKLQALIVSKRASLLSLHCDSALVDPAVLNTL